MLKDKLGDERDVIVAVIWQFTCIKGVIVRKIRGRLEKVTHGKIARTDAAPGSPPFSSASPLTS